MHDPVEEFFHFVTSLLAFTALSAAQSSILVIDTSNNASYNQVHWLVGTPYLAVKASNGRKFCSCVSYYCNMSMNMCSWESNVQNIPPSLNFWW